MSLVKITNTGSQIVQVVQKSLQGEAIGGTTTYLEPGQTVDYDLGPDTYTVLGVLVPRGTNG